MRTREELVDIVEKYNADDTRALPLILATLQLEVLLDIRQLLIGNKKEAETRRKKLFECASCHKTPIDDPRIVLTRMNIKGVSGVFLCQGCITAHVFIP